MKKIWKVGVGLLIVVTLVWVIGLKWHRQNQAGERTGVALRAAGKALASARKGHTFVYAPGLFSEGEKKYEAAMLEWKRENKEWFFSRDYDTAIKIADESKAKIAKAVKNAAEYRTKCKTDFEGLIVDLSAKVKDFESFYSHMPLPDGVRNNFVKGRILFSESQRAGDKGNMVEAYNKAKVAASFIRPSYDFGKNKINNYFKSFPKWEKLNREALSLSHSQKVIMVDKIARRCYVYKNGKVVQSFVGELGRNWVGDKERAGDKTTPEGRYHITKKIKGSNTIYYKALLINYPNDEDKERFNRNKASGAIAKSSKIGGLIEIHGGGGQGTDWTDGCVALTNKNMDKIYAMVDTGTPVFIVGSLVSLSELKTRDSLRAEDE